MVESQHPLFYRNSDVLGLSAWLDAGADPECCRYDGRTAGDVAVKYGNIHILELLNPTKNDVKPNKGTPDLGYEVIPIIIVSYR